LGNRRRWEDNIKTDLKETKSERVEWIQLAQGVVLGSYEHVNVPSDCIIGRRFIGSLATNSFPRRTLLLGVRRIDGYNIGSRQKAYLLIILAGIHTRIQNAEQFSNTP
jgi:hypothetical protein